MTDFVWPSDNERAYNDELDRVCDYLEDVLDELQAVRAESGSQPVMGLEVTEDRTYSPIVTDATFDVPPGKYSLYTRPVSKVPEVGSKIINEAAWRFIEALPDGPLRNACQKSPGIKPSVHAALSYAMSQVFSGEDE